MIGAGIIAVLILFGLEQGRFGTAFLLALLLVAYWKLTGVGGRR